MTNKINIAIDGYSGTGKSSTAREVASRLGYTYLDSGAMYRAITLYFLQQKANWNQPSVVEDLLKEISISFIFNPGSQIFETCLNGQNVEHEIRGMEVSNRVSEVSAINAVRDHLVRIQQDMGIDKGVVMDGRDIGTVVFPNAELKIFMTADTMVRAKRRQKELEEKGTSVPLDEIVKNIESRDKQDTTREASPLVKAQDAIEIDTSNISFEKQVEKIVALANQTSS